MRSFKTEEDFSLTLWLIHLLLSCVSCLDIYSLGLDISEIITLGPPLTDMRLSGHMLAAL